MMNTWAVQDAKARFSDFLQACLTSGPQWVTRRGQEVVPVAQWRQLQANSQPSLKQLLLEPAGPQELVHHAQRRHTANTGSHRGRLAAATHHPGTRASAVDECDAQVGEGSQIEPDWDMAAQLAPDYKVDQCINW